MGKIRFINSSWRWQQHCRKKGGEKISYSGHKHQKGEKTLAIADNSGNIIAPFIVEPINVHDTNLFPESLDNLIEMADEYCLDLTNSYLTLDSGFSSQYNKYIIIEAGMTPVIKPNLGPLKNQEKINKILDEFESVKHIYKERYKIEKSFAWEDKYRKLVIRYEKLQCTFMGFRFLAYSMINFRSFFGKN